MRLSVSIDGEQALQSALRDLGDAVADEVRKEVYRAGFALQGDIKERIQRGPKTGNIYTHRFVTINGRAVPIEERGAPHQASAAGQAPASDTGALARSVYLNDASFRAGRAQVSVGSDLVYAAYLEYGTRKIAQRPAWTPAAHEAQRKFRAALEAVVKRATQ